MEIELEARGFELGAELERYARRKLIGMQRHVPRAVRESAACSVKFSVVEFDVGKASTCNLVLQAGEKVYAVSETTEHMYAAFDIAVARVRQHLIEANKAVRAARPRARIRKRFRSES